MREARFNSLVFGPDSDDPRTKTRGGLSGHQQPRATTQKFPVAISKRPHPIPSRTRKLSSSEPMVLHGKPCGRVGRCREILRSRQGRTKARSRKWSGFFALWPDATAKKPAGRLGVPSRGDPSELGGAASDVAERCRPRQGVALSLAWTCGRTADFGSDSPKSRRWRGSC